MSKKHVIIIGGGAAGYFAANQLATLGDYQITIFEQGKQVLQKVKISGGGRCNVTNAEIERKDLASYYPRGWKLLRKLFSTFNNQDLITWFAERGVELKTEPDNRMFPITNKSQTIIDCLRKVELEDDFSVHLSTKVVGLQKLDAQWEVETMQDKLLADYVLVATGSGVLFYNKLKSMEVKIDALVPSLFTFNIDDERIADLPGLSVQNAQVKLVGSKQVSAGPLLITHWGMSGPAILKMSSWAAETLNACQYKFKCLVNFTGQSRETIHQVLTANKQKLSNKLVTNSAQFDIPKRLWRSLMSASKIDEQQVWGSLNKKQVNAFVEQLCNAQFQVDGKSTFKEEFVTCGGVALSELQSKTLEHRRLENLFFAGEVMNVDAITGGFNFQSAWTTAYVAAQAIHAKATTHSL